MTKQKRKTRAMSCAAHMPELAHSAGDGRPFDIMESEVAAWLCMQPEIRQYVFDAARETGYISYDPDTRKWCGVER